MSSFLGWLFGPQDHFDSLAEDATVYPLEAGLEWLHTMTDGAGLYADVESLPAVSRARRLLAGAAAQLPVVAYRDGEPLTDQPRIVARPDPTMTRRDFVYESVDALIRGDVFWRWAGTDAQLHPSAIVNLPPGDVSVSWNEDHTYRRYSWRETDLTAGVQLTHIRLDPRAGRLRGRSILESPLFRLMAAAESAALSWYTGDGEPVGVLHSQAKLDGTEAEELRRRWVAHRRQGRVGVTSGGLEYRPVGADPEKSQLLETRRHHTTETARLFGIPAPLLLAELQGSGLIQYANIGQLYTELVRSTLAPEYLAPIEQAWSDLLPRTITVRFDTTVLSRADDVARYNMYATAIGAQILTADEVRRWEGIPGAAERTPPSLQEAPASTPPTDTPVPSP